MDEKKTMEVELQKIMMEIPVNSVELEIRATVYDNGNITRYVTNHMDMKQIRDAFLDAKQNYDDPDGAWVINEKAEEALKNF